MSETTAARRLLDLAREYAELDAAEAALAEFGQEPERSRDDIAADYATALRELIG